MRSTTRVGKHSLLVASGRNILRTSVDPMTNDDEFRRILIKLTSHSLCELEILCFIVYSNCHATFIIYDVGGGGGSTGVV